MVEADGKVTTSLMVTIPAKTSLINMVSKYEICVRRDEKPARRLDLCSLKTY